MTAATTPESRSLSLLCVDDDPQILFLLKTILGREPGFIVETSTSATGALDLLSTHHFDAILSDYYMPEMDGISLLKEIRSRGIPALFVIFTGRHIARVAIDTLNNGGNFYIQKGPDFAEDIPKLVEFLRNSQNAGGAAFLASPSPRTEYLYFAGHPRDLIISFRADGSLSFVNDRFAELAGIETGNLQNESFFSRIPDDELDRIRDALGTLTPEEPGISIEHHISSPENNPRIVQWTYRALFDSEARIVEYQALGRDVSDIVRLVPPVLAVAPGDDTLSGTISPLEATEEAATGPGIPAVPEAESDVWKALADSIENLQYPIFAVDMDGIVKAWNSAIGHLTGVYAHEIVGKGGRAYSVPFYGEPRPMLIDYIVPAGGLPDASFPPTLRKDGDAFIGTVESITINGKFLLMGGRATAVNDRNGNITGAVQSILVSEHHTTGAIESLFEDEQYIGGISSIILKVTGKGLGGAIAGAIGAATGGFGVYATNQRLFVVHNPELDATRHDGVQFGTFIVDELFGMNVDLRPRSIRELERSKVFEVWRKDIVTIEMKKPRLLAGFLIFKTKNGESFRVYIDHQKAFTHIEQLLQLFSPEILEDKTQTIDDSEMGWIDEINTYDLVGNLRINDPLTGVAGTAKNASALLASRKGAQGSAAASSGMWEDLRSAIEPVQYPIFAIDKAGKVVAWNSAIARLTGVPSTAIIGKGDHAYAAPFYDETHPMLIDYIVMPPDTDLSGPMPDITREGDTFIGDLESVTIQGKPMLMWGKGTGIYDPKGALIAAIQSILVREKQQPRYADEDLFEERYIGGISSITVKAGQEGTAGAIAGAIGTAAGGYGVYATDQRLFIIHNPELDATRHDGVQFGAFIIDELFGTTVDTRPRSIRDLEKRKVFEVARKNIKRIEMKKPMLLAGYIVFRTTDGESFRVYIDHKRAYIHLDQLLRMFYPEILMVE